MDTTTLTIIVAIGATLMTIAVGTAVGYIVAQRLDRKLEQSSADTSDNDDRSTKGNDDPNRL